MTLKRCQTATVSKLASFPASTRWIVRAATPLAALLGARIDAGVITALFQGQIPAPEVPEFPQMIGNLRSNYADDELAALALYGSRSVADSRVRAGVLLAPAIGSLLEPSSLEQVEAPVLIRWGEADEITPAEENARVHQRLIPRAHGGGVGEDVGHYVFLGDRDDPFEVRTRVADDMVAFFATAL